MPTSTRFVVSIHALAMLASHDGRPVRSEDLAAGIGTNAAVVRALLARLAAAGLTASQLGNGGGALLKRPADAITLLDVYVAVEDREIFSFHRALPPEPDAIGRHLVETLAQPLAAAREAMERELAAITVADVLVQIRKRSHQATPRH